MIKEYLNAGKIVGTHGVRGMVRIEPWADNGAFLQNFESFYLDDKTELKMRNITPHGNIVIAKIEGVDTIDAAERFRGKVISIRKADAPELAGRYFIEEILGSTVYNSENGEKLGTLTQVFKTGANDVWQVSENGRDYLLPVIADLEIKVEAEKNKITLKPLKGIFEDED